MKTNRVFVMPLACFALLCLSSACAGSGGPKGAPGEGEGCKGRTTRAVQQVQAAVEKNRSCKSDQDCVLVAISADCFDACTRNVSVQGEKAVKAAIDAASASECGAFHEDGCNRVTPPCAPPALPKCNAGLCE